MSKTLMLLPPSLRYKILAFFFLITAGVMTACAKEDKKLETSHLTLLTKVSTDKQAIEKTHIRYNFRKGYKESYQYSLILPKIWKILPDIKAQYPTNDNIKLLAKIVDSQNIQDANITVWSTLLTNEMHPADWLSHWLKNQQYHVLDSRILPTQYGNVGDFLVSKKGKKEVSRLITTKDGDRIFLLMASAKNKTYKRYEETFLLAIQSFQLLHPKKELYAEPFKQEQIKKPYEVTLRYPTSWEHHIEPAETKALLSINLINKKEKETLGQINIVLSSLSLKLKADDLLQTWIGKMKANHIQLENAPATVKTEQVENKKISTWQSKATRNGASIMLRNTIIEHDKGALMISLVSPSQTRNYIEWAINQRAYEILLKTAKY